MWAISIKDVHFSRLNYMLSIVQQKKNYIFLGLLLFSYFIFDHHPKIQILL